jgi:hypothetical protein
MQWGGQHFVDAMLPFIIVVPPKPQQIKANVAAFEAECEALGVTLAPEKEGPSTKLVFLGIEIDTVKGLLALHAEKLSQLRGELERWRSRRAGRRRELESLIGILQHSAKAAWADICPTNDRSAKRGQASAALSTAEPPIPSRPVLVEDLCRDLERGSVVSPCTEPHGQILVRCLGLLGVWGLVRGVMVAVEIAPRPGEQYHFKGTLCGCCLVGCLGEGLARPAS